MYRETISTTINNSIYLVLRALQRAPANIIPESHNICRICRCFRYPTIAYFYLCLDISPPLPVHTYAAHRSEEQEQSPPDSPKSDTTTANSQQSSNLEQRPINPEKSTISENQTNLEGSRKSGNWTNPEKSINSVNSTKNTEKSTISRKTASNPQQHPEQGEGCSNNADISIMSSRSDFIKEAGTIVNSDVQTFHLRFGEVTVEDLGRDGNEKARP